MCLLSVLRDLWRSRSFDIGGTQWLAREQRTVNTVITTSITTKSIILFIVNRCCCCCCCWHLWCCVVLMTVGHALPHLLQVRHHTVNKAWTLLWHPSHAVDDAWTCSANMPRIFTHWRVQVFGRVLLLWCGCGTGTFLLVLLGRPR